MADKVVRPVNGALDTAGAAPPEAARHPIRLRAYRADAARVWTEAELAIGERVIEALAAPPAAAVAARGVERGRVEAGGRRGAVGAREAASAALMEGALAVVLRTRAVNVGRGTAAARLPFVAREATAHK